MEDGIANAATTDDLSTASTTLTALANAKVPSTRTVQGVDLSVNRTYRLDQWNAPTAPVSMGNQVLSALGIATADDHAMRKDQVDDAVSLKMDNTSAGLKTLLGGKIPCVVPYDDLASSWHSATYASQAADANYFFFFIFGVDDGTHNPFSTAGGSAWILFEET
jgi:hypothetical protein